MILKDKTALVCGASSGIGRSCAVELARLGAQVVLLARSKESLEKLKEELGNRAYNQPLVLDIGQLDNLEFSVKKVLADIGPVEIVICNTGGPPKGEIFKASMQEFNQAFQNHVIANSLLAKLLVPGMKEKSYGRIINIISTSVKSPIPNLGVSNTIRAAVASWAKTLSWELARYNITVNNVLPGFTLTARLQSLLEQAAEEKQCSVDDVAQEWRNKVPMGRFGTSKEIAAVVGFLASPLASYVNGVNLPVDGGRTLAL